MNVIELSKLAFLTIMLCHQLELNEDDAPWPGDQYGLE
jgi:hypothetical protein